MTTTTTTIARGGAWLIEDTDAASVFTPERLTEEHRLMAQMTDEFIDNEVLAQLEELEKKNWKLARDLVKRCGELGLLGVNVSEQYGGVNLDKISSLIVSERIARSASFAATFGGCANLCILPIFLFGTEEQKQKYLPKLLTGELVGAYALSESGSGSDALGAKARATKQADGSWVLNGEKMWITNGGFAVARAVEEFVVEASIAKVAGSETLNYVLDENVQIHGGNGYVHDYPAERHYRDARVNRIFEGTNEINRLLIPGMLARRAVKGDVAVIPAAKALQDELMSPPSLADRGDGPLDEGRRTVQACKKAAL